MIKKIDAKNYCKKCTACCQWPGTVTFKPEQLSGVASCLKMNERDCADTFFVISKDRQKLQTKPTIDGSCIFISKDGCLVYEHRPEHCRTFPYKWQRPEKKYMEKCSLYQEILSTINIRK